MKNFVFKSVLAGLLIGFAGVLFLLAKSMVSDADSGLLIGALLFSLGLLSVILMKANLFTGKVGYFCSFKDIYMGLLMLVLNLAAAFALGLLFKLCVGNSAAVDARLLKTWYRILFDSTICGMCVFLSVDLYKRTSNILTIILPVIAFIVCGGEHCIGFAFYLGAGTISLKAVLYLGLMIVGNSAGALLLRLLSCYLIDKPKEAA
ncbi:MAG: formate/nitrite transporter family protein [Clostridia bacterium]|nr:formate/nitrite transporter family protein [Clostridia bacterium]